MERDDDNPLPGSRLRYFIFLSPLSLRLNCLLCHCICSSIFFSHVWGPLLSAYAFSGVCLSCNIPNFAISLLRTVTICLPGSLMVEFLGLTFSIFDPGAKNLMEALQIFLRPTLSVNFAGQFELHCSLCYWYRSTRACSDATGIVLRTSFFPSVCVLRCASHPMFHLNFTVVSAYPFIFGKDCLGCYCVFI